MRLLALGTVVALLTWGAAEAIAAARPCVPELPSTITLEEAGDCAPSSEPLPRSTRGTRDLHTSSARADHPDPRERTTSTLGIWHPTRHARDDSPDH